MTMANAPLVGWDGQSSRGDLGGTETEIFFQMGLDTPVNKPPDGQISTRQREQISLMSRTLRSIRSTPGVSDSIFKEPIAAPSLRARLHFRHPHGRLRERLRPTAWARDRRNDHHADGAAGRLRDSRRGHHAAPLHVRSLDRVRVSSGVEVCSSRDLWR